MGSKRERDAVEASWRPNPEDERTLRAAGFSPVLRWVDMRAVPPNDVPYKTAEALAVVSRRQRMAKLNTEDFWRETAKDALKKPLAKPSKRKT